MNRSWRLETNVSGMCRHKGDSSRKSSTAPLTKKILHIDSQKRKWALAIMISSFLSDTQIEELGVDPFGASDFCAQKHQCWKACFLLRAFSVL